jgi:putative spermidine/putrescine transport system substrate-binding protein
MRRWMSVVGFAGLALLWVGGSASAADTELVVAGYGGSFETIFKQYLGPAFEKKFNVKVNFVSGNSTETLARVQAQKDNPQIDVTFVDDGPAFQGAALGLWEPIDPQSITNLKDLYDLALHRDNLGVDMGVTATGLMYATETFKQKGWAPPTSWADIAKAEHAGHLVIPPIQNSYGLHALVMFARMNGGGEKNINPGFEAIKKFKKNVLVFEAQPGKHSELFQSKQAWIGVWGSGRVYALADTGFPVEFVYPKEGAMALAVTLNVVKGTKQKRLANEFINAMLGPEAQEVWAEHFKFGPYNKTVKLKPEIAKKAPYGPAQIGKLIKVDWDTINQMRREWTERWNKEIEG